MQNLLPIADFITAARKQGAAFEAGDPKIHLAYLTKLGLLPHAIKRKLQGEVQGCYPESAITKLLEIQDLKNQGMTYAQIAKTITTNNSLAVQNSLPSVINPRSSDLVLHMKPSNFAYLVLGLIIGIIVSTLNTSGLAAMKQNTNLELNQSASLQSQSSPEDLYLIAVPKQNLDKIGKTNINYLIKN